MLKLNNSDTAVHGSWYRMRSQEVGDAITTVIMIVISREELDGKG